MKALFLLIAVTSLFFFTEAQSKDIKISSFKELAEYAAKSSNIVTMEPGNYALTDYLTEDSVSARVQRKCYQLINFSGSDNVFKLEGVVIEVDTKLRTSMNPPIHTNEFTITGNKNTIQGLEFKYFGNGTSHGGAALEVAGEGNTIRNVTLLVTGSFPYGYGDLFGKGGPDVIRHQKHSGLLVTGSNTKLFNCKLYMHSFGHGFFVQKNAENIYFEDCYVEGKVRKTDDVLKETSGPAFDVHFRTWTKNREGEYIVTPGYMKSLCEDGFRTYGEIKNVHFRNCTAKNTRGGFELRTNGGIILENCSTIGTERAYWVGDGAKMKNCKGDANYGPLMFLEGSNCEVEVELMPAESDRIVHALMTVQGSGNKVTIKASQKQQRTNLIPILIGYTHPEHGESMSPFGEGITTGLVFKNKTNMPVIIGEKASDCTISTVGKVMDNKGMDISIIQL